MSTIVTWHQKPGTWITLCHSVTSPSLSISVARLTLSLLLLLQLPLVPLLCQLSPWLSTAPGQGWAGLGWAALLRAASREAPARRLLGGAPPAPQPGDSRLYHFVTCARELRRPDDSRRVFSWEAKVGKMPVFGLELQDIWENRLLQVKYCQRWWRMKMEVEELFEMTWFEGKRLREETRCHQHMTGDWN